MGANPAPACIAGSINGIECVPGSAVHYQEERDPVSLDTSEIVEPKQAVATVNDKTRKIFEFTCRIVVEKQNRI